VLIFVLEIFVLPRVVFKVFESFSNVRDKAREANDPITKARLAAVQTVGPFRKKQFAAQTLGHRNCTELARNFYREF